MGLGLGLGLTLGPRVSSSGTSATRYSFAATRLKFPTVSRQVSGLNTFLCQEFYWGSPDYGITNPRFFMPSFISDTGANAAEVANPNTIQIEGISIKIGGIWYAAPTGQFPITIDPTTSPGSLLPAIAGITIPANTMVQSRVAYNVPAAGFLPTQGSAGAGFSGGGSVETSQGSTTTLVARLTDNVALTNANSHADTYIPAFMVAQGGDARPAVLMVGDSIGFGVAESSAYTNWSVRGACGYMERGLDDNTTTKRLAYAQFCIPSMRPTDYVNRSYWAKKLDAVKAVQTATGALPFDTVFQQGITNSVPQVDYATLLSQMQTYLTLIRSEWPSKTIVQMEALPLTTSTDGFTTVVGQVPATHNVYPTGQRWRFNADVGVDGIASPTTTLRTGGYIDDSIGMWRGVSADLTTNRDKFAVQPFSTTVAASYTSGSTISLTAAPTVGMMLGIGTNTVFDALVTAVTGVGPYTVTFQAQSATAAVAAGGPVQELVTDKPGVHPGTRAHANLLAPLIVAWKSAKGYV